MDKYELISSKVVMKWGKVQAEKYLALPESKGERSIRGIHVRMLREEIKQGEFLTGHIVTADLAGRKIKANGQHVSKGLLACPDGTTIRMLVEHYRIGTPREFATFYEKFDHPMSTRTWSHILKIFVAATDKFDGWPHRVMNLCICAIGFEVSGRNQKYKGKMTRIERCSLLEEFPEECSLMFDFVKPPKASKHLMREPIFNAMYQTILADAEMAEIFWGQVREGYMLKPRQPAFVLREKLLVTKIASGHGTHMTSGRRVPHNEMYAWCIHAWNAMRDDRQIDYLRWHTKSPLPKAK